MTDQNQTNTMSLGGLFPVITFDRLPDGMERGNSGRSERTKYEWATLLTKQGIMVPGDKYLSASSSAQTFARNHPHDDAQLKKIAQHIAGKVRAAKAAAEKEGKEWTPDMEKAVKADPQFVLNNSRAFRTEAVKDKDTGEILKVNGTKTKAGTEMADNYYIIRTN